VSRLAFGTAAALAVASLAGAAEPPSEPRRFTLGVELSAAAGPEDLGFFNYTSYEDSTQRLARLSLTAEWRITDRAALLAEVRDENLGDPRVYALYARLRPWPERSFDVQAGLIPPVFGAFARRRYGSDNPLIGYPLAYQYLTNLRTDAVPGVNADLLVMRGAGWLVRYPFGWGDPQPAPGLPLVNALRWDTGVQARLGSGPIEASVAVTQGTLSNPRVRDDNSGKQLSGRVAWKPVVGLVVGASGARGEYLSRTVVDSLPAERQGHYRQHAWGVDLEYSRDRWIVRSEAVWSRWQTPMLSESLGALGLTAEGRYKIIPGLYAAARVDHLGFSEVEGLTEPLSWDAPVWRVEAGIGYTPIRHVLGKLAYQHNWRDGGRVRERALVTAQVVLWF
jgi:hypothetical protein